MTTQMEAGYVYAGEEDGVLMVGFADHQYDTNRYVLLQRDKNASEGERKAGEAAVHITVDDQSRATYGGIVSAELRRASMRIVVEPEQASVLKTDQDIVVRFHANDQTYDDLVIGLKELFALESTALKIVE